MGHAGAIDKGRTTRPCLEQRTQKLEKNSTVLTWANKKARFRKAIFIQLPSFYFQRSSMFKPFKSWAFAGNCLLFLFSSVFWASVFLGMVNMSACDTSVSLDRLEPALSLEREVVELTDHQPYGEVFRPFEKSKIAYQLLVSSSIDLADVANLSDEHFVLACDNSGQIARALEENQSGYWSSPTSFDDDDDAVAELTELDEAFSAQFPDLDYHKMGFFRVRKPLPLWGYGFGILMSVGSLLAIPFTAVKTYRKYYKDQEWRERLDEDRTEVYRSNPNAMRLVGATQFMGEPRPISRQMDIEFDVAPRKEVKRPKLKRWTWMIGIGAVLGAVGGLAQFEFMHNSVVQNFLGEWAHLIAIVVFGGVFNVLIHSLAQKNGAGRQEITLEADSWWARFRKSAFYQYHDRVLNELGFITMGHFRQAGAPAPVVRTIYLSPTGNLLVEIGCEAGKEYFTIESVTNNEKFLETHSLCKLANEKNDIYQRHQRKAADHEDIVRALGEHDALVGEFTGSAYREAQFTEERFPRFLEWVSRAPKEDDKLEPQAAS